MLPESLLSFRARGGALLPDFLGPADHPWLRALLDLRQAFAGRAERELTERLREPLTCAGEGGTPPARVAMAACVLDRLARGRAAPPVSPRAAREAAFLAAAEVAAELAAEVAGTTGGSGGAREVAPGLAPQDGRQARHPARDGGPRAVALARAARDLETEPETLERCLFSDLPGQRPLAAPPASLSPHELALRTNAALAAGLLYRASHVSLEVTGDARRIVRHARWRGLICTVRPAPPDDGEGSRPRTTLELSGPLSLFKRTLVYGRALGALVPLLPWCQRFHLRAACRVRDMELDLTLATGDPLHPADEPERYDSRLEEHLARDLARLAPEWEVVREPEAVQAGDALVFPDFLLRHRHDPARWALLEVVGFWTPDYLRTKLARLRAAGLERLILCVDATRNCSPEDLPEGARVVSFRRRVPAEDVVRLLGSL